MSSPYRTLTATPFRIRLATLIEKCCPVWGVLPLAIAAVAAALYHPMQEAGYRNFAARVVPTLYKGWLSDSDQKSDFPVVVKIPLNAKS